jgi:hypothetical protein
MNSMNTTDVKPIPAEVMAELQAAAEQAASDVRDPEAMRKACERMDRMREKNRALYGEQDIGVDIIREMRDSR